MAGNRRGGHHDAVGQRVVKLMEALVSRSSPSCFLHTLFMLLCFSPLPPCGRRALSSPAALSF